MRQLISLFAALYAVSTFAQTDGKAVYLGNEALLIKHIDTKVLFDPFFHNSYNTYQLVPESIRKALFSAEPPYDGIDAIFISHAHGDHYAAQDLANYLQQYPAVKLIAPEQAIEKLRALETPNALDQNSDNIVSIKLAYRDPAVNQTLGNIKFDAVRIPHAGWPQRADVANIVYRVILNDSLTVMHMGDADPDDEHFASLSKHWNSKLTHMAFPPYWFFSSRSGPMILNQRINARKSVGVHVPITVPAALLRSGAQFFHVPGEHILLETD